MKHITFVILGVLLYSNSFGQRKISLPFSSSYNENATILLGIHYNLVSQSYQLKLKKNWQQDYPIYYGPGDINNLGELKSIQSKPNIGFSVGIPVDIRTNDNLYFTFNPSFLFFNGLGIEYKSMGLNPELGNGAIDPEWENRTIVRRQRHVISKSEGTNFTAFEFPLSIKFRSDEKVLKNKFNRYRAYLIGGARYTRWIGINGEYEALLDANNPAAIPQALIMKPGYLSWEAGLGADIFFAYFKMSPEIKFNQSFGNVFAPNHALAQDNKFMAPIEKGLIRNIYVSLIFQ